MNLNGAVPIWKTGWLLFAAGLFFCGKTRAPTTIGLTKARSYYINISGNDHNDGSLQSPWQSIGRVNQIQLHPGDQVLFSGGQEFKGTVILDSADLGSLKNPMILSSYGKGHATINGGNGSAVVVNKTSYLVVKNMDLSGAGRKNGNTKEGIAFYNANQVKADSLDISGFQKTGLLIYGSSEVSATHIFAHDNGAAGITVEGPYAKKESCHNIYIGWCRADNNPGDPTNLTNHSGNGIVAGDCRKVLIEYCSATNNGWDMPRIGNGPVGIWAYEADSVTIQHCLSYANKTSLGGADGGGFDLDGGVTNSVVQYCLSYGNQGAGYSIFQYLYASPWHDNVFRYNISENDGSVSDAHAGVHIWNSSRDSNQFYNCLFYNNTIYNTTGAALSFSELSERKNFIFCNNIFVGEDSLIKGWKGIDTFVGDDWWSLTKKFNIEQMSDFTIWAQNSGCEMMGGKLVGLNINPLFTNAGNSKVADVSLLKMFDPYQIPSQSQLLTSGIDVFKLTAKQTGGMDFNGKIVSAKGIGACL